MRTDVPGSASATTIYGLFATRAALQREHLAVLEGSREVTYGALLERVNRLANWLQDNGVVRGDRIAMWSHNRVEYLEVELAAAVKFLSNADLVWGFGLISRTLGIAFVIVIFFLTAELLLAS